MVDFRKSIDSKKYITNEVPGVEFEILGKHNSWETDDNEDWLECRCVEGDGKFGALDNNGNPTKVFITPGNVFGLGDNDHREEI